MASEAVQLTIRGIVQGVGFRPFVYRIAQRCRLAGRVHNRAGSVIVHVEGRPEALGEFRKLLVEDAPPAARIVQVKAKRVPLACYTEFSIRESEGGGALPQTGLTGIGYFQV